MPDARRANEAQPSVPPETSSPPSSLPAFGAFTVGSIRQHFAPTLPVRRGDFKAQFEIGGSTVVLLFEPGAVWVDADILEYSCREIEVRVRCGESIGVRAAGRLCPPAPSLECAA